MPVDANLASFAGKQVVHFRSSDLHKGECVLYSTGKTPVRPNYGLILGSYPNIAPSPWAMGQNMHIVDHELDEFVFENYEEGMLKESFRALLTILTWGSQPVKISNYWTLPGSRIEGDIIPAGNVANAATYVSQTLFVVFIFI